MLFVIIVINVELIALMKTLYNIQWANRVLAWTETAPLMQDIVWIYCKPFIIYIILFYILDKGWSAINRFVLEAGKIMLLWLFYFNIIKINCLIVLFHSLLSTYSTYRYWNKYSILIILSNSKLKICPWTSKFVLIVIVWIHAIYVILNKKEIESKYLKIIFSIFFFQTGF